MKGGFTKLVILLVSVATLGAGGTFAYLSWKEMKQIPDLDVEPEPVHTAAKAAPAGGHGEAPPAEGGHGATAEGHGAPAPAADGHGAPPAEGHGAPAAAEGHGAPPAEGHGGTAERSLASKPQSLPLLSLEEVFVNVGALGAKPHSLGLKLELELFDEANRSLVESRISGIRNAIIMLSREQDFATLSTVPGKLYFTESLVSKINEFLKEPMVRDLHFSSFFLQ